MKCLYISGIQCASFIYIRLVDQSLQYASLFFVISYVKEIHLMILVFRNANIWLLDQSIN